MSYVHMQLGGVLAISSTCLVLALYLLLALALSHCVISHWLKHSVYLVLVSYIESVGRPWLIFNILILWISIEFFIAGTLNSSFNFLWT